MPDPEPITTDAPASTPPVADAAPPTITIAAEEYERLKASMAHMQGVVETLQGQAGRPVVVQQAPQAPPQPVYTEAQLAEMMESGDGKKMLDAQRILLQQQVAPVVEDYQRFRASQAHMNAQLGQSQVELEGRIPYYKDPTFKKQIDEFLNTLPANARENKESIEFAHNYIIAKPENLTKIVAAKVEEEMRKRGGAAGGVDTSASGGRVPESPGSTVKGVAELLGESAAQALRFKGQSADDFAKKIGYKDWAAYATQIEADQAESAGETQ